MEYGEERLTTNKWPHLCTKFSLKDDEGKIEIKSDPPIDRRATFLNTGAPSSTLPPEQLCAEMNCQRGKSTTRE